MLNNSTISLCLKVLSSLTFLQLSDSEFSVVRGLTSKAFNDKASNMGVIDSKFLLRPWSIAVQ